MIRRSYTITWRCAIKGYGHRRVMAASKDEAIGKFISWSHSFRARLWSLFARRELPNDQRKLFVRVTLTKEILQLSR